MTMVGGTVSEAGGQEGAPFLPEMDVVPVAERAVCNLRDQPGAEAAMIRGQDAGDSIDVDGTTYWLFGDTLWKQSMFAGKDQAGSTVAVATTSTVDAANCVDLKYKTFQSGPNKGKSERLFPPNPSSIDPNPDNPDYAYGHAMAAVTPGSEWIHFFWTHGQVGGEAAGSTRGIGAGRFRALGDADALQSENLTPRAESGGWKYVWDNGTVKDRRAKSLGVGGVVYDRGRLGDFLYVFLVNMPLFDDPADAISNTILARLRCDELKCPIHDEAEYEYYHSDTGSWNAGLPLDASGAIRSEAALWPDTSPNNGVRVAFNEKLGKWVATYWAAAEDRNTQVRTAATLEGPWSEKMLLIRCDSYYTPDEPDDLLCYSPTEHAQFAKHGDRTMYVSLDVLYNGDIDPQRDPYLAKPRYFGELHEVQVGTRVYQCDDGAGNAVYRSGDCGELAADGVAYYAMDIDVGSQFVPIFEWTNYSSEEIRYAPAVPSDSGWTKGATRFYGANPASIRCCFAYDPVYRWTSQAEGANIYSAFPLDTEKYLRKELAFIAVCPDSDLDGISDCREAYEVSALDYADTDSDGLTDGEELQGMAAPAGAEVGMLFSNPFQADSDGEGLSDGEEVKGMAAPGPTAQVLYSDPLRVDTDADGCTDAREVTAPSQMGGQRNPLSYWDFYDTPDSSNRHDGVINVADIRRVLTRFGARGNPGVSPLVGPIPGSHDYHPAFDRGGRAGTQVWSLKAADGGINLTDVMAVIAQFGHQCRP